MLGPVKVPASWPIHSTSVPGKKSLYDTYLYMYVSEPNGHCRRLTSNPAACLFDTNFWELGRNSPLPHYRRLPLLLCHFGWANIVRGEVRSCATADTKPNEWNGMGRPVIGGPFLLLFLMCRTKNHFCYNINTSWSGNCMRTVTSVEFMI